MANFSIHSVLNYIKFILNICSHKVGEKKKKSSIYKEDVMTLTRFFIRWHHCSLQRCDLLNLLQHFLLDIVAGIKVTVDKC